MYNFSKFSMINISRRKDTKGSRDGIISLLTPSYPIKTFPSVANSFQDRIKGIKLERVVLSLKLGRRRNSPPLYFWLLDKSPQTFLEIDTRHLASAKTSFHWHKRVSLGGITKILSQLPHSLRVHDKSTLSRLHTPLRSTM